MKLLPSSRWVVGGLTLAVWALAAGSALFWYLRADGGGAAVNAPAAGAIGGAVQVDTRTVARALGAPETQTAVAPAADVAGRLALRGVVTHQGKGAALISIDGKPPLKPLRVGAPLEGVDGGWAVRSVSQRAVVIAAGERQAKLEMPPMELRSSKGDAVAPLSPPPGALGLPMPPVPSMVPVPPPADAQATPDMGTPTRAPGMRPVRPRPSRQAPGV